MSVNPGLDIRTDAGPPPVLEEEKKTFDQILLEKNIAALFGIGTAYFTYKAHPMTRKLVKNHGWIGFLNVLTVPHNCEKETTIKICSLAGSSASEAG
jgi:hypothetical protein